MSKPPRDVTVRFAFAAMATRRWNSSRTAVYAGATSRVNTVPDNVQQQIKVSFKFKCSQRTSHFRYDFNFKIIIIIVNNLITIYISIIIV